MKSIIGWLIVGLFFVILGTGFAKSAHSQSAEGATCSTPLSEVISDEFKAQAEAQGVAIIEFTGSQMDDIIDAIADVSGTRPPFSVDKIVLGVTPGAPVVGVVTSHGGCINSSFRFPAAVFAKFLGKA